MRAAITRAAKLELASTCGLQAVAVVADIHKLFDCIPLANALGLAREQGYPSWVLALVAQLRAALRILKADGAYSEPIAGRGRSTAAGCAPSTSLALAVVFEVWEEAHARYPLWAPQCHIDDLCGVALAVGERGTPLTPKPLPKGLQTSGRT